GAADPARQRRGTGRRGVPVLGFLGSHIGHRGIPCLVVVDQDGLGTSKGWPYSASPRVGDNSCIQESKGLITAGIALALVVSVLACGGSPPRHRRAGRAPAGQAGPARPNYWLPPLPGAVASLRLPADREDPKTLKPPHPGPG